MNTAAATLLAEQISSTLTTACLAWGEAINAAEKAKGSISYETLAAIARRHGAAVAELSAAIAGKLRPR